MPRLKKKSLGKKQKKIIDWLSLNLLFSRLAWEANIAIIRKHNLEHDLGLHSYTLGMNKYGDLV